MSFDYCKVTYIKIVAHHKDDLLFSHNCIAKQLECKINNEIIIWNENVIHHCPYSHIMNVSLFLKDPLLIDFQKKLAFKFQKFCNQCNSDIIETTDGLQLFPIYKNNYKSATHFLTHHKI